MTSNVQPDRSFISQSELTVLLDQVKEGKQEALSDFYARTSAAVYSLVFRILREAGAAEEVVSDVYLQVWCQASRFQPSRGNVLAWLFVLARSRAIDRLRSQSTARAKTRSLHDVGSSQLRTTSIVAHPERVLLELERRSLIGSALGQLNLEQRKLVEIGFFQGLTHREMAQALGMPLGTVKTRIRGALLQLRRSLLLSPHLAIRD